MKMQLKPMDKSRNTLTRKQTIVNATIIYIYIQECITNSTAKPGEGVYIPENVNLD